MMMMMKMKLPPCLLIDQVDPHRILFRVEVVKGVIFIPANNFEMTSIYLKILASYSQRVFSHLSRSVSNSCTPCSMMERLESSQATFIRARSTSDFGLTIVSRASSDDQNHDDRKEEQSQI